MAEIDLIKNSSFENKLDGLINALSGMTPADGFTPVVEFNKVDGVGTISITTKTDTSTLEILDGVVYSSVEPTNIPDLTWISNITTV